MNFIMANSNINQGALMLDTDESWHYNIFVDCPIYESFNSKEFYVIKKIRYFISFHGYQLQLLLAVKEAIYESSDEP